MRTLTLNEIHSISGAGAYADSWGFFGTHIGNTMGTLLASSRALNLVAGASTASTFGKFTNYGLAAFAVISCATIASVAGNLLGSTLGSGVDAVVYLQNRERR